MSENNSTDLDEAVFALPEGTARCRVENGRLTVRLVSTGLVQLSILPEAANTVTIGFHKTPRKRSAPT